MPRFSCSLTDEQADWLKSESERLDRSKADIVRQCITLVQSGSMQIDEHRATPMQTDVVRRDELESVEERVADLEAEVSKLNQQIGGDDSDLLVKTESAIPSVPVEPLESDAEDRASDGVVQWVRENQPASKADIVAAFEDVWESEMIKGDSWWRRDARPQLEEAGFEFVRNKGWLKR